MSTEEEEEDEDEDDEANEERARIEGNIDKVGNEFNPHSRIFLFMFKEH